MVRTFEVPLFPLPGTVLFPGITLPFYVFEPRYRAMLAESLDGTGLLGIPLLHSGFEASVGGHPPIARIFGVGSVEQYVTHADGTSHILVRGRWKVELLEELPPVRVEGGDGAAWRRALVRVHNEQAGSSEENHALRGELRAATSIVNRRAASDDLRRVLERLGRDDGFDPAPVLHLLCALLIPHPARRQALLECRGLRDRARALRTMIEELRRKPRTDPSKGGTPSTDVTKETP